MKTFNNQEIEGHKNLFVNTKKDNIFIVKITAHTQNEPINTKASMLKSISH
jgi:hypothetical protein